MYANKHVECSAQILKEIYSRPGNTIDFKNGFSCFSLTRTVHLVHQRYKGFLYEHSVNDKNTIVFPIKRNYAIDRDQTAITSNRFHQQSLCARLLPRVGQICENDVHFRQKVFNIGVFCGDDYQNCRIQDVWPAVWPPS